MRGLIDVVIKALGLVSGGGEGWTWDLTKVCFRSPDSQLLFFAREQPVD